MSDNSATGSQSAVPRAKGAFRPRRNLFIDALNGDSTILTQNEMNRKNESAGGGNGPQTTAQQLQWLSQQVESCVSALPPSGATTLSFVSQLLACPGSKKLKRLAILAGLTTIVNHAGGTSSSVLQNGLPPAYEQVEWDSPHRGRTFYLFAPGTVEIATVDGVLPPFGDEGDLSHIIRVAAQ